ncbi:MAG: bifunctional DNA primase/polymerase [Hyphomicrobium sp.]
MRQAARGRLPVAAGQLSLALEFAGNGIPVFPVSARDKRPITEHSFHEASTDQTKIATWWRRNPSALVSAPTGAPTGFWVLDIDKGGHDAFNHLLARLGCETVEDLSPAWVKTPSGGLHLYFILDPDTTPRTRASDIAAHIDTRGLGGSIVLPGNVLPDSRAYQWAGPFASICDAPKAPRGLLWLATFNARERREIRERPELLSALRNADPTRWATTFKAWRDEEAARILARCGPTDDDDGMRRQALHDLHSAASEYAGLQDGRRAKLFSIACRLARYVSHGVVSEAELSAALISAARTNGALSKHGMRWAESAIRRAMAAGSRDALPPLARSFRSEARP